MMTLYVYTSDTCIACHNLMEIIKEVLSSYPEIKLFEVDIHEFEEDFLVVSDIQYIPCTVLVDSKANILFKKYGTMGRLELETKIKDGLQGSN